MCLQRRWLDNRPQAANFHATCLRLCQHHGAAPAAPASEEPRWQVQPGPARVWLHGMTGKHTACVIVNTDLRSPRRPAKPATVPPPSQSLEQAIEWAATHPKQLDKGCTITTPANLVRYFEDCQQRA